MTDPPATFDHVLEGCRPVPLASYLKALGVLRLVSEQADEHARGWWRDDRFILRTRLDSAALTRFFLEDYAPTPIIAPWNGGSGFFYREEKRKEKNESGKRIKTGVRNESTTATRTLDRLARSKSKRLANIRSCIELARRVLDQNGIAIAPADDAKYELISLVRNSLPSDAVEWIDSAAALLSDIARFPPLLGTGGNDGNFDFSSNFHQRLAELQDLETGEPTVLATQLFHNSLFDKATSERSPDTIGQFSPGEAGGPNATVGADSGDRARLVNRWDFVLMIEGAIVFSGGVSRRLESVDGSYMSYPFTVRAAAAGFGTASIPEQGDSRGELWAPLWNHPVSISEVRALFREGRLSNGSRPARDGLDAARGIGMLGADRRVAAFERYGFVMRQGRSFLAAPLGRRVVRPNPRGELLSELDGRGWFDKVRRAAGGDQGSAAFREAVRGLEEDVFALLDRPHETGAVQQVLVSIGAIARATALRPKLREEPLVASPPPPRLSAHWRDAADDGSPEWRVAVALAGLQGMTAHLGPMKPGGRAWAGKAELGQAEAFAVWGEGSLVDNLGAVVRRRLLAGADEPFEGAGFLASSEDIAAFLDGRGFDDRRAAELLLGLAWVRPGGLKRLETGRPPALPFAYAAIKPLFTPGAMLAEASKSTSRRAADAGEKAKDEAHEPEDADADAAPDPGADGPAMPDQAAVGPAASPRLPMPPALPGLLAAGRVGEAVRLAQGRARASGLATPFLDDRTSANAITYPPGFGPRLLAALAIPVWEGVVRACLRQAYPAAEAEPAAELEPADAA